jgi:hypothetical protein
MHAGFNRQGKRTFDVPCSCDRHISTSTPSFAVRDRDPAAMQLRKAPRDCQPEACARAAARVLIAEQPVEYLRQVRSRDRLAGIEHRQTHGVAFPPEGVLDKQL